LKDLPLIESSAKWFVRKVAPPGSDGLLDRLDERVVSETRSGPTFAKPVWIYVAVVLRRVADDGTWTVVDVEGHLEGVDERVAIGSRLGRVEMLSILGHEGYEAFGVRPGDGAGGATEETYYLKRMVPQGADDADGPERAAPRLAVLPG
jgi:hypothetical protein